MGEIKSTLDLVMERTRHMALSPEEKARQQREDFEKRVQGLLQQYADQALSADALLERLYALQAEMNRSGRRQLIGPILRRADPDQDNDPWLDLLERLAPEAATALGKLLDAHHRKQAERLQAGEKALWDRLARDHGITGPAAVPNPLGDSACRHDLAALGQAARSGIEALARQFAAKADTPER